MADDNSSIDAATEDNRERIEKWLSEFGYQVENLPTPKYIWTLRASDQGGLRFFIGQVVGYPNEIIIETGLNLDGVYANFISGLKPNELKDFISDLRLRLFMINAEARGLAVPFKTVIISQYIYTDGLTQDTLFQRLFQVRKGYQITLAMLQDAMDHKS